MENNPNNYTRNLTQSVKNVRLVSDLRSDHLAISLVINIQLPPPRIGEQQLVNFGKCNITKVNEEMEALIKHWNNEPINPVQI